MSFASACKTCSVCRNNLPLENFSRHCRSKDGHVTSCKTCTNAKRRIKYASSEEHAKRQTEKYRKRARSAQRKYYWKNPERAIKTVLSTRDPKKHRAASLRYYWKNRDKLLVKQKERLKAFTKDQREEKINRPLRERMNKFPELKILDRLRQRLKAVLAGERKSQTTRQFIGCCLASLRAHLESLWKPGMSWENYGPHGWHIDHIIPCASFDLTDPKEQKRCFHYTNLQPLWAKDNYAKGKKMPSREVVEDVGNQYKRAIDTESQNLLDKVNKDLIMGPNDSCSSN